MNRGRGTLLLVAGLTVGSPASEPAAAPLRDAPSRWFPALADDRDYQVLPVIGRNPQEPAPQCEVELLDRPVDEVHRPDDEKSSGSRSGSQSSVPPRRA